MAYKRKTADEWVIQGYYAPGYGWEDISTYDNRTAARVDLKTYRESEPQYQHRLIKRRVKIEEAVS